MKPIRKDPDHAIRDFILVCSFYGQFPLRSMADDYSLKKKYTTAAHSFFTPLA